jgi:purine-nucleoside/S-methyl-5'-thioadenosine phosphorylase / adenosine deaminase
LSGVLTIPELAREPGLVHGFSTSELGSMRRSDTQLLTPARREFARRLGLDPERLSVAGAVHGAAVARVDSPRGAVEGVDVLLTNRQRTPLFATFADCYPLILFDPVQRAVALIHAGWRGTAAGVTLAAVGAMTREYGSRPSDLVVGLGPGICGSCYEVGDDVAAQFDAAVVRPGPRAGAALLDLAEANRRHLVEAGVPPARIHSINLCTKESPDLPSHRREPDGTRFAGIVALG